MTQANERIMETVIWLASCAIHGVKPEPERLADIDAGKLFLAAKRSSVSAMIYMTLEGTEYLRNASEEIAGEWKQAKEKAIAKRILFDDERRVILRELEKAGIWYVPLKGINLQDLYPRYGMREMCDNDILFDDTREKDVSMIFKSRGYKEDARNVVHLTYEKIPVYSFEMHRALFEDGYRKEMQTICQRYRNIRKYLVKDEEHEYGYHLSSEEEYIYLLAHMYKHYMDFGPKIRDLIDLYLMVQRYHATWDETYIRKELQGMQLEEFEKECRALSMKLFGASVYPCMIDLSDSEKRLLRTFFVMGTHDSRLNKFYWDVGEKRPDGETIGNSTKIRYIFKRLCPSLEECKYMHPAIRKHPWLYPCYLVWRIVKEVFANGKKVMQELRFVFKA